MEDDFENTTNDEAVSEVMAPVSSCKLKLDIQPRRLPKALAEAQVVKLNHLKKTVHALKLDNETLKAENQAMKKNIERYYELVLQAREKKKVKGSQNVSSFTLVAGILIACTIHINSDTAEGNSGERQLMLFGAREISVYSFYAATLILLILWKAFKPKSGRLLAM